MGNRSVKNIIVFLGLCSFSTACEEVDFKGMFIPYETPDSRFEQSIEWNRSHPYREIVVPTDDYGFFSMGDSHVGGTKNLDKFMAEAISARVAAVVMVGDLTTGQEENYDIFMEHLPDPGPMEIFPVIGNHDLYFNGWEQFFSRLGSSTYLFTVKTPVASDLFVCLDSGSGSLGSKQLGWLKDVLEKERPKYRRCILFSHNNLFRFRRTTSTNPLVEELYVLMDLFVKYEVDMVITAHDHKKDSAVFGNTIHIIMDALSDDCDNAGYLKVSIKNGKIDYLFTNF